PPAQWEAADWADHTADALALRSSLDALVADTMAAAEEGSVTVDEVADLESVYSAGSPSVASVTTDAYDAIMADAFEEFVELIGVGAKDLVDESYAWVPGEHGGVWGGRGIHEGGLEIRQLVDKGLFAGGALYPYAVSLTEGPITVATIDAIAAAWGGDQAMDFENRTDSANYTYGMGMYADMVAALTAARAYAADDACAAERDEALVDAFRIWEKAMYARFVFYANRAATTISAPTAPSDLGGAAHAFSEGVGLGIGFFGMPDPAAGPLAGAGRLITDADIESVADAFGIDLADLGASTTGPLLVDPAAFQDGVDVL